MRGILISGFPGVGKSYAAYKEPKSYTVIDVDSSNFTKEGFPQNYVDYIMEVRDRYDVVMISSHMEVRQMLEDMDERFYVVFPSKHLRTHYLDRYHQRGSSKEFINLMNANWDDMVHSCVVNDHEHARAFMLETESAYLSHVVPAIREYNRRR